jgi:hypothetical protein
MRTSGYFDVAEYSVPALRLLWSRLAAEHLSAGVCQSHVPVRLCGTNANCPNKFAIDDERLPAGHLAEAGSRRSYLSSMDGVFEGFGFPKSAVVHVGGTAWVNLTFSGLRR